jgi:hypothetical protein
MTTTERTSTRTKPLTKRCWLCGSPRSAGAKSRTTSACPPVSEIAVIVVVFGKVLRRAGTYGRPRPSPRSRLYRSDDSPVPDCRVGTALASAAAAGTRVGVSAESRAGAPSATSPPTVHACARAGACARGCAEAARMGRSSAGAGAGRGCADEAARSGRSSADGLAVEESADGPAAVGGPLARLTERADAWAAADAGRRGLLSAVGRRGGAMSAKTSRCGEGGRASLAGRDCGGCACTGAVRVPRPSRSRVSCCIAGRVTATTSGR